MHCMFAIWSTIYSLPFESLYERVPSQVYMSSDYGTQEREGEDVCDNCSLFQSEPDGFATLHVYVCAALLSQYSEKINHSPATLLDIVTTIRSQYVWKSLQCKLTHCSELISNRID